MEADFLRAEGQARGIDLRVAATFLDDLRLLADRPHDAVILGCGRCASYPGDGNRCRPWRRPDRFLLDEVRDLLARLRAITAAPILINNLPVPTVQPLGMADRGLHSHRNRFRRANLELDVLATELPDVHIVDIDAALSAAGKAALLDDSLVSFTHFGSLGWMLQRPEAERAAVHDLFPNTAPLMARVGGDPYGREKVVAREHADRLVSLLGVDRKKCVIVDLDGTLWPGVLAETGRPFAWHPETSSAYGPVGLYFGLHEALKALKQRGILLACVSKNDETTVRDLWRYDDHYPHARLIHPEDFVTSRINWQDKDVNILSIAEELGLALSHIVFIDDNAVERERVRQFLPEGPGAGRRSVALRYWLLTDPRLQPPVVTAESAARTQLVQAQLQRAELRRSAGDEAAFRASLGLVCQIDTLQPGDDVRRVRELFERTTQFNTTGRRFTELELAALLVQTDQDLFTLRLQDRFGDHGLVGACVVQGTEITGFALSCRALGLGIEHRFMEGILERLITRCHVVTALLIATDRNLPVRNLYRDHGFTEAGEGCWQLRAIVYRCFLCGVRTLFWSACGLPPLSTRAACCPYYLTK